MTDAKTLPRRRRRKDARPEEIISAALLEFGERGYGATSIGHIAARAEIARSTFYLYFEDKEAVIIAAFDQRVGGVFKDVQQQVPLDGVSFEDGFRALLQMVYGRLIATDTLVILKVLVAEGQQFPNLLRAYHRDVLSLGFTVLERLLRHGIARGEVRADIFDHDIKMIVAPSIMAAFWQLTFDEFDPIDLPKFVEGHLKLVVNGIRQHGPSD